MVDTCSSFLNKIKTTHTKPIRNNKEGLYVIPRNLDALINNVGKIDNINIAIAKSIHNKLSLSEKRRPRWSVTVDALGRPTVTPSVHVLNGCRCHFWIRRGAIDWVGGKPGPST